MPPRSRTVRGRGSGGPRKNTHHFANRSRPSFKSARVKEIEDELDSDQSRSNAEIYADHKDNFSEEEQPHSENEQPVENAYSYLLQTLVATDGVTGPLHKKRKVSNHDRDINVENESYSHKFGVNIKSKRTNNNVNIDQELTEASEELEDEFEDAVEVLNSNTDEEDENTNEDPFLQHFVGISEQALQKSVQAKSEHQWTMISSSITDDIKRTTHIPKSGVDPPEKRQTMQRNLTKRLHNASRSIISSLSPDEMDLSSNLFAYRDVVSANRSLENSSRLRDICCLHSVNHILKTRTSILKNSSRQSQQQTTVDLDLRDQGFTRPKVVILVPTKQACVRFIDSIVKFSEPEQQENKSRFLDSYGRAEEDEWPNKPADFRELFAGNHEEDFRIGLKFTRKTIKYFSSFYNSDIIIASPLGLMRILTAAEKGEDKEKGSEADFLSSIEIVIMDHANALQMQNWQHVESIFSQLNHLPKQSHGCDFSRVRHWYLDGKAKYLRQTIILSDYNTPEINSLVSNHLHNTSGQVKYVPTYKGAMLEVATTLPISINQTFTRFDSPSVLNDHDIRFKYFTSTILPTILRNKHHQRGVLIFIPSYLDFTRLRNHLSTSNDTTSLTFGSLSEYTDVREVTRSRAHFVSGRSSILLYTERAHHYFRYNIKGVRRVIFYGVPENPIFWTEIITYLGLNPDNLINLGSNTSNKNKGLVRAMFSKWDAMKLERIVGSERVGKLISDRGGDTFDFV